MFSLTSSDAHDPQGLMRVKHIEQTNISSWSF